MLRVEESMVTVICPYCDEPLDTLDGPVVNEMHQECWGDYCLDSDPKPVDEVV